ncbi:MAG: rubrerythrin family protein [Clostridiales bacterium]|nr:rubrerythrin family protein [Clostridiales bacterium]
MNNNFENSQTYKNLARSFAGECQAGARYQFLSKQCLKEGYNFLSNTIKTLAKNEMAHAKTFFDLIVNNSNNLVKNIEINAGFPFKYGDLCDHFKYTMEDEKYESENIYPEFSKIAKEEGFNEVAYTFDRVASVENCHYMLIKQIYEGFVNKNLYSSTTPIKWKCSNCGNEHTEFNAWEICDLCGMQKGYVEIPFETGKTLKNSNISDIQTL